MQKEKKLINLQNQESEVQRVLTNERINLWELEGHIKKVFNFIDLLLHY